MKWHENGIENRQKDGKIVGFRDLTKFMECAADPANIPIYSKEELSNTISKPSPASSIFTNYSQNQRA